MHDANGQELNVGDVVSLQATIKQAYASADRCNLVVKPVHAVEGYEDADYTLTAGHCLRMTPGVELTDEQKATLQPAELLHVTEADLMKLVQSTLTEDTIKVEGACAKVGGAPKTLSDGHDFVHAMLSGSLPDFFKAHGVAVQAGAAVTPAQIIAIVKTVCGVAVPLCQALGTDKPAQ